MENEILILVADDENEIIESVKLYLYQVALKLRQKIKIFEAISGVEALEIIERNQIDLIFVDYLFQNGMNGDEILQQIPDPFGNKFIVLMSGWKEDEVGNILVKNRLRLKSRLKFIRKPFELIEIQDRFLEYIDFAKGQPYPSPLHYAFNAIHTSQTQYERILSIKDFFESLMKFSIAILMSDLHKNKKIQGVDFHINITQPLTYGAWLTWLENLIKHSADSLNDSFAPELLFLLQREDFFYIKLMYEFKNLRDAEIGHGFAQEDKVYEIKVNSYFRKVEDLYNDCRFFTKYTLVHQEKSEILDAFSDETNYQVRVLMGAETKKSLINISLLSRLANSTVYLFNPRNMVLSLSPFMIYDTCTVCSSSKLYMLDRLMANSFLYNSYCNHRLEKKVPKSKFDEYFLHNQTRK